MTTIADRISKQLANSILAGELLPGDRIEEVGIAAKFGVSRTPVREALRLLAAAGLVNVRPHKGVTVTDPQLSELSEIFETLSEIEALCARFSAQRMTTLERHQLQRMPDDAEACVAAQDHEEYSDRNEAFHKLIYRGAHNACLEQIALQLWNRVAPFRRSVFFRQSDRMRKSLDEHRGIVSAIVSGQLDASAQAMRAHVVNSAVNATDYLSHARETQQQA